MLHRKSQHCVHVRTLFLSAHVATPRAIQGQIILGAESIGLFFAGLVLVVGGAELVLRGASRLAGLLGINPMVIGLTIVSVGTSAPELAVGLTAVAEGRGALAVGNIAGTNMLNILFILGLSAAIRPLSLQRLSIKLDLPVMVMASLALVAMAWDGVLSQTEGFVLIGAAVLYTAVLIHFTRRERAATYKEAAEEQGASPVTPPPKGFVNVLLLFGLVIAGIAVTVWGADLLVNGAVGIARTVGVSDAIIGLTIVAIGTSAPELATTVVATIKDERDVAVGNLLGSSSYNILAILGATCAASPGGVQVSDEILLIDLPLAVAVALVCIPVFTSDRRISRREGVFFVATYLAYLTWLIVTRT